MKPLQLTGWWLFAILAIGVGLYPLGYWLADLTGGLLRTKPDTLLADPIWSTAFYSHISLGGLALLCGWSQFHGGWRRRWIKTHRWLGMIYCASVVISGLSGFYIALYATGGLVAQLGFSLLAVAWLFTTGRAFHAIRGKDIEVHREWMTRSYALCFAAVTLRLWLPMLVGLAGLSFFDAYPIVAWLCWVPNLLVAEWLVRK